VGTSLRASSSEVLGKDGHNPSAETRWDKQERILRALRESILRHQRDLLAQATEATTTPQQNLAELGSDHYDRDLVLGLASSEQEILYEIDQALNRIAAGTYGICELTGKIIPLERLEAVPWTRFSAEAEEKLEAEGKVRQARLGTRQGLSA
jgi:RNA polymerase-binding transcription factor DksA